MSELQSIMYEEMFSFGLATGGGLLGIQWNVYDEVSGNAYMAETVLDAYLKMWADRNKRPYIRWKRRGGEDVGL